MPNGNNNDNGDESQEESDEQTYDVEKILDVKNSKKGKKYLIRWLNYGSEDDTWEYEENLKCPELLEAFKKKLRKQEILRSGKTSKEISKDEKKRRRDSDSISSLQSRLDDSELSNASSSTSKATKLSSFTPKQVSSKDEKKRRHEEKKRRHEEKKRRHKDSDSRSSGSKTRHADSEISNNASSSCPTKVFKAATSNASASKDGKKQRSDSTSATQLCRPNSQLSNTSSSAREASKNSTSAATIKPFKENPQSEGNQTKKPNNKESPAPSTIAKISDILAQNPIVKKEVLSELSGDFSSSTTENNLADVTITPIATTPQSGSCKRDQTHPKTVSPGTKASKTVEPSSSVQSSNKGNVDSNNDIVCSLSDENGNNDRTSSVPHQCFGNSSTLSDFAKKIIIRNVNNSKMEYVFSTQWKIRCEECSNGQIITDETVDYAFAIITYSNNHYFLIKLKKPEKELFLIEAEKFREICAEQYLSYCDIVKKYFETLGTLEAAIEQQHDLVKKATNTKYFQACKANVEKLIVTGDFCEEAHNAFKEIVKLFFYELQLAIGKFMCKQIDSSSLHSFVMDFYEKRNPLFNVIKKEAVENKYEALYINLVAELQSD